MKLVNAISMTILLLLTPPVLQAADEDLIRTAKDVTDRIIKRTNARQAELKQRPERIPDAIGDIVRPYFDFSAMASSAMGKYWRSASSDQQNRITNEFSTLLIRTYGAALLNYSGKPIEYKSARRSNDNKRVEISSVVTPANSQPISIDYRLHQSGGNWRVYEVQIDGVSMISNYRSSFASEIRKGGIDGLISELKRRNSLAGKA
jgi:phospholipid transport system substrate-binding protein